ncbi:hypothetical protein [Streptomyces sp. A1136]|uniref:hypothetical protein n=1 Tax=Streptomyces sp. A1136 TaxID=2563102 RepID=UPI00109E7380|nr:hypothetical protein [Streptomyces sp. A1136]THA51638.1 hypothetical protein E6R62_22295 [Streptomyces sp. A1136]
MSSIFAAKSEVWSPEHLALEHLDPVDMPMTAPRASGQAQPGDDGVEVAVDAGAESVEAGQVGLSNGVEPLRETLALEAVSMVAKDRT